MKTSEFYENDALYCREMARSNLARRAPINAAFWLRQAADAHMLADMNRQKGD